MEERALVRRAQAGSAEAANRLFEAVLPFVVSCAAGVAAYPDHVDEIVQEAMVGIVRGFPGFDGSRRLKPWCWTITVNAAARYMQADAVAKERAAELSAELQIIEAVEEPALDGRVALRDALARVEPEHREILTLLAIGIPVRKIAEFIGQSKSTTQRRIEEARDALRKEMGT